MRGFLPWLLAVFLWGASYWSCQNPSPSGDSGVEDGLDDLREGQSNDTLVSPPFELVVPEGLTACALDSVNQENLYQSFTNKGRITFKAQTVAFPRNQDKFSASLFNVVEWGVARSQPKIKTSGEFSRSYRDLEDGGVYHYRYSQEYELSNQTLSITLIVRFQVQKGEQPQLQFKVDDSGLADSKVNFWADYGNSRIFLSTCTYASYTCSIDEYEIAGGDRLRTEACRYCPAGLECSEDRGAMKRAWFSSGSEEREITDYFRLAHSWKKQNQGTDLLIFLDQAVGTVRGFYLTSQTASDPFSFSQVNYLSTSLKTTEVHAILKHEQKSVW